MGRTPTGLSKKARSRLCEFVKMTRDQEAGSRNLGHTVLTHLYVISKLSNSKQRINVSDMELCIFPAGLVSSFSFHYTPKLACLCCLLINEEQKGIHPPLLFPLYKWLSFPDAKKRGTTPERPTTQTKSRSLRNIDENAKIQAVFDG